MPLSPEDKIEMRAMMVDVMGGLVQGLQRHLDQQILELQADVDTGLEKLDSLEFDIKSDLREIKTHVAKLSRERIRDVRREDLSRERELSTLTEIAALKYRVSKLEEDPNGS